MSWSLWDGAHLFSNLKAVRNQIHRTADDYAAVRSLLVNSQRSLNRRTIAASSVSVFHTSALIRSSCVELASFDCLESSGDDNAAAGRDLPKFAARLLK